MINDPILGGLETKNTESQIVLETQTESNKPSESCKCGGSCGGDCKCGGNCSGNCGCKTKSKQNGELLLKVSIVFALGAAAYLLIK